MNALDFLVDFATSMSTPTSMTTPQGVNGGHKTSVIQSTASASRKQAISAPPTASLVNEAELGDWTQHDHNLGSWPSSAPSSSKLESLSGRVYRASADRAMHGTFGPPSTTPQCHPIAQPFGPHLREEPSLYCEFNCGASCQPRPWIYERPLEAGFDVGYSMPIEEKHWDPNERQPSVYGVQRQPELPFPDVGSQCEYSCQGRMCHWQPCLPHSDCVMDGCVPVMAKGFGDPNVLGCDDRTASGYGGWMAVDIRQKREIGGPDFR